MMALAPGRLYASLGSRVAPSNGQPPIEAALDEERQPDAAKDSVSVGGTDGRTAAEFVQAQLNTTLKIQIPGDRSGKGNPLVS